MVRRIHNPNPIADRRRSARRSTSMSMAVLVSGALIVLTSCHANSPTKIGTFTPQVVNGSTTYSPTDIATEAKAVGVRYARVQQQVGNPLSAEIAALRSKGITAHLVVKSPDFGRLPSDLDAYRRDLAALLDKQPTPLMAVQNEETVDKFWLDTPDNYLRLLDAATEVAHRRHIPATNGGIDRLPIALATWNHLRLTQGTARADRFLEVVFDNRLAIRGPLTGIAPSDPDPYRRVSDATAARWKEGEYLLAHYGTDADDVPIDYVNFHWYVTDDTPEGFRSTGTYTDIDALRDVVRSVKEITGKPAVTNEIGQYGRTPEAVTGFLNLLRNELQIPWVFWFDADGIPAQGLHENDQPGNLRPNGLRFARLLAGWEHR